MNFFLNFVRDSRLRNLNHILYAPFRSSEYRDHAFPARFPPNKHERRNLSKNGSPLAPCSRRYANHADKFTLGMNIGGFDAGISRMTSCGSLR